MSEKSKEDLEKDLALAELKAQIERLTSFKDIDAFNAMKDKTALNIDKVECARRNVELLMKLAVCDPMAKLITGSEISKQIKANLKTMELIN